MVKVITDEHGGGGGGGGVLTHSNVCCVDTKLFSSNHNYGYERPPYLSEADFKVLTYAPIMRTQLTML